MLDWRWNWFTYLSLGRGLKPRENSLVNNMWSTLLRMKRMEYGRRSQSPNALKNSSRLCESNVLPLKIYLRWNFKSGQEQWRWVNTWFSSPTAVFVSLSYIFEELFPVINSIVKRICSVLRQSLRLGRVVKQRREPCFFSEPKGKQFKHHSKSWCWKKPRTQFSSNVGKALGWSLGG